MNLLEAATTIATTADIETLFALYSQSRAYEKGKEVRAQIEARVNEIAALNGYEEEFKSFREFVERYDNDTSPLWDFVSSGTFLVTDVNHPLPYSFSEFLNLFRKIYDKNGLVVIGYRDGWELAPEPYVKYRLLKTETGLRFIHTSRYREEVNGGSISGRRDEEIEGGYDEDFLAKLPEKFTKKLFGKDYGFCKLRFSDDFYRTVDFFCYAKQEGDEIEVFLPLTERGELQPVSVEENPGHNYVEIETIYSTTFEFEAELTFQYKTLNYAGWGASENGPGGEESYFNYKPYLVMSNPLPYYSLSRGLRYAAYLRLIKYNLQIGDIEGFDFHDYDLPLSDEDDNWACYDDGEALYVACHRPFTEDEITLLTADGFEISDEGPFEDFYFYILYREEEGEELNDY